MKVLITGSKGQLGIEFRSFLEKKSSIEVLALPREELDIGNSERVNKVIESFKPGIIINCSAYNYVDKAENDYDSAFRVNALGVKNLAIASERVGALLIHYSTDYVFDGKKEGLYTEEDIPGPLNKYGLSKLEGEKLLREYTENFLLFRVSWVFGFGKQNFLHKLMELGKENSVLKIAFDQISAPTYTEDIVKITWKAIRTGLKNRIYHLTNTGYASRYEVAHYYFELLKKDVLLLPVLSEYFKSAAHRPYFSAMSNKKISNDTCIEIPHWQEAMKRYLRRKERVR